MYAAVIENSCGLSAWRPNSAIGHATSMSPTGPFKLELVRFTTDFLLISC